jgi:hypothetical protein
MRLAMRFRYGQLSLLVLSLLFQFSLYAQEHPRSITVKGFYTTTSRLFNNLDGPDEIARSRHNTLDHIFGYGIDVRHYIPGLQITIGASVEYLEKSGDFFTAFTSGDDIYYIPTIDGYRVIPIELTGFFTVPFSSDRLKFYIGGGAGLYLGERSFGIGDVEAEPVGTSSYPGIHVLSGIDYYIFPRTSLRAELKFRDPDIKTKNRFERPTVIYNDEEFPLPEGNVNGRINVDGMVFMLGVVFNF